MTQQQQQLTKTARQKSNILDNLNDEWDFLKHRIRIQESVWKNFEKPTDLQEIKLDKEWAKEMTKLVSLFTKLKIANVKYEEACSKSEIKLYIWRKENKDKEGKSYLKLRQILNEYYELKKQFVKKYPLE